LTSSVSYAQAPDGVRIRIHHLGGSGPPLLCVHATGFHGRLWEPFVPKLREHFTVIALDQRGHGESDKPDTDYRWKLFGDDVLAVLDALEVDEPPVGIGHSAGAAALIFAESTRPGTFSRLVLLDPTTLPSEFRGLAAHLENPMAASTRKRRAIWDSTDQMVERFKRPASPFAGWRDDFLHAYAVYGTRQLDDGTFELVCPPHIEAKIYETAGSNDGWDRLAEITCETLLLTGTDSPMWAGERSDQACDRLLRGDCDRISGGHFFPMENPDDTVARTLRFLAPSDG
jgi:pimeloyl-ACP methyl ester carboxylesterase